MIIFPLGASIKLFFVGYCAAGHSNRYNTAVARPKRKPLCRLESGVSPCVCAGLCVPLCFIVVPLSLVPSDNFHVEQHVLQAARFVASSVCLTQHSSSRSRGWLTRYSLTITRNTTTEHVKKNRKRFSVGHGNRKSPAEN